MVNIHERSGGLPRLINELAMLSLDHASRGERPVVDTGMTVESLGGMPPPASSPAPASAPELDSTIVPPRKIDTPSPAMPAVNSDVAPIQVATTKEAPIEPAPIKDMPIATAPSNVATNRPPPDPRNGLDMWPKMRRVRVLIHTNPDLPRWL